MTLAQRMRDEWALAVSVAFHLLFFGAVLLRYQPPPQRIPPPALQIRLAPAPTPVETVAAIPAAEEPVVAATAPPMPVQAAPPPPEPDVVRSKSVDAPVMARRMPEHRPQRRPMPEPQPTPPSPRPVQAAPVDVPASRPVRAVTTAKAAPHPARAAPAGPPPDYLSKISAQLQRYKEYPRGAQMRHIEGNATLWFVINRSGQVVRYRIVQSSGYSILDGAVDAMIRKAQPFPPMPASMTEAELEITQPVTFNLR